MPGALRRYGFAAAVAGVLALMAVTVLAKDVFTGADKAQSGGAGPGAGAGGPPPAVEVATVASNVFADEIQALGTAQARESVLITSKVTDVIRQIRFESGDRVAKGQVLVELANVEQQADLSEAQAQLEADRRSRTRFDELFERGFAPRSQVDEARANYARSEARVQALRARIADRTIRAPFAGVIGLRTASPGLLATPGEAIATLDDVSTIKLDFDVPEPQLGKLKPGLALTANTAAFPDSAFTGRIEEIDSRVNTATRTVRVRALIPNPKAELKPGMLMTVRVRARATPAPAAPEMALLEEGQGVFVFRVAEKGQGLTVERVKVQTGRRTDGLVEVLDGLAVGDRVVVQGLQRVRPGQPIRVRQAGAPAAEGARRPDAAGPDAAGPGAEGQAAPRAAASSGAGRS